MNAKRKKELLRIINDLEDLNRDLNDILSDEEEEYDELSEKSREGKKFCIDTLIDATGDIDNALSSLKGEFEDDE